MKVRSSINTFNRMEDSIIIKYTIFQETLYFIIEHQLNIKRYWIDKLRPSLNINKPKRTRKEWTSEHRAKTNARAKELRELKKIAESLPPQETL